MKIRIPFLITGLLIPALAVIIGIGMLGNWHPKPPPTTVAPEKVRQEEEQPAEESRKAEEKISGYSRPEALTSIYSLNEQLGGNAATFVIDARGRSHQVLQLSYQTGHIPGAVPFLHSNYCHPAYPGRIGTPLQFQGLLTRGGAGNNSSIVIYGNDGLQARMYWALRMYGYDNVSILDGGFEKWQQAGLDVTLAAARRPVEGFSFDLTKAKPETMLATLNEVTAAVGDPNCIIVDARRNDEYLKQRIPGSVNLSSVELFNEDRTFKWARELKALADSKNITPDSLIIVYSNAGIRSCLVWFALSELLGYPYVKNYDGSMYEWIKMERQTESGLLEGQN